MTTPEPVAPSGGESAVLDSALLADIAGGDEAAFGRFYDRFADLVYGLIRRVVRDDGLAQEVTQEVFVELWRTAPRYDPTRGSVRAWTATIARRRAIDRVRSEQARRNREGVDAATAVIEFDDVSETVGDSLERGRVVAVLAALTDGQRQALTLAYYGGHSYRDVARILEIPEGTAKTRIRDALTTLRKQLGPDR